MMKLSYLFFSLFFKTYLYQHYGTGFGSWAFHPDFEQNGLFYTTHNEPSGTASADFPVPDSIKVTVQAVLPC